MRKVGMSVSLSMKIIMRIDEHIEEHGGNFSGFVEIAAAYYLDHNQTVSTVSINDSEPNDIIDDVVKEALKDIPEDTEPPPTDNTPKTNNNDFNWDGIKL